MKLLALTAALLVSASQAEAQDLPGGAAIRCDSVVAVARVDSIPTGLFFTALRLDAYDFTPAQATLIATEIAGALVPPVPLRVGVFDGPPQMSTLRRVQADSTTLRAGSITGVYRFTITAAKPTANARTVRASLVPGLDRAMLAAIDSAGRSPSVAQFGAAEDSVIVQIRISTDSGPGAGRVSTINFPRLRVVDAVPMRDNPRPVVSASLLQDGPETVLLRFVVGADGIPDMATVELARGRSGGLVRAALEALSTQLFTPATVAGCPVSQVVYYPFSFVAAPEISPPWH